MNVINRSSIAVCLGLSLIAGPAAAQSPEQLFRGLLDGSFGGQQRTETCRRVIAGEYYGGLCSQLPAADAECRAACEQRLQRQSEDVSARAYPEVLNTANNLRVTSRGHSNLTPEQACERAARTHHVKVDIAKCASDVGGAERTALAEEQARQAAEQERRARETAERQAAELKHQQELAAKIADIRAGKRQPENLLEAMAAQDAQFGTELASAPKIRPDGKVYGLVGVIEKPGKGAQFIARVIYDPFTQISAAAQGQRLPGVAYFHVTVPRALHERYYNAKVGARIRIVGRYNSNVEYATLAGELMSAPSFEVVYWE